MKPANFLSVLRAASTDRVPAGFRTCEQWARAWKLSRPQAFRYLANGLEAGLMTVKKFRLQRPTGVRVVPHYAEIKRRR